MIAFRAPVRRVLKGRLHVERVPAGVPAKHVARFVVFFGLTFFDALKQLLTYTHTHTHTLGRHRPDTNPPLGLNHVSRVQSVRTRIPRE